MLFRGREGDPRDPPDPWPCASTSWTVSWTVSLATRVQAEGLIHISPGQRPGFMDGFLVAGQRPASLASDCGPMKPPASRGLNALVGWIV